MLEASPKTWYWDGYCISTEQALLQPEAVNAAFGSDMLYWCQSLPLEDLKTILRNSLCFGVYTCLQAQPENTVPRPQAQIGFARLITDNVTFAYLTDVYILPEHQGQGLGRWVTKCMDEVFQSWPLLRRIFLVTSSPRTIEFYRGHLGVEVFDMNNAQGLVVMGKLGRGSVTKH